MQHELVTYSTKNRIIYITLNRPDKRNALSNEMVKALQRAFDQSSTDPEGKVVILQAQGNVFCAGADLASLQALQQKSREENMADSLLLRTLFLSIYQHPKVVIAKIHGHAIAGGCGLISVCDFAIAVPEAQFGYSEVKIGFVPAIVAPFLIRKIGENPARALLLSGDLIAAETAKRYQLLHEVVPAQDLSTYCDQLASRICHQCSSKALTLTKQIIAQVQELPLNEALEFAAGMNARARETDDCKKGIAAFINKEKLVW
jgi:methylglutaconyl-CoA hydratase